MTRRDAGHVIVTLTATTGRCLMKGTIRVNADLNKTRMTGRERVAEIRSCDDKDMAKGTVCFSNSPMGVTMNGVVDRYTGVSKAASDLKVGSKYLTGSNGRTVLLLKRRRGKRCTFISGIGQCRSGLCMYCSGATAGSGMKSASPGCGTLDFTFPAASN